MGLSEPSFPIGIYPYIGKNTLVGIIGRITQPRWAVTVT